MYAQWQNWQLQRAVNDVMVYHWSKKRAAKEYDIPRATPQRYMNNCRHDWWWRNVEASCTDFWIEELIGVIQDMERRIYGLTPECVKSWCILSVRKIALNTVSTENDRLQAKNGWICFSSVTQNCLWENRKELQYTEPLATTVQKSRNSNFEKVLHQELFHNNGDRRIPVENIFNVDETGVTVNQNPRKIIATNGKTVRKVWPQFRVLRKARLSQQFAVSQLSVYNVRHFSSFQEPGSRKSCWIEGPSEQLVQQARVAGRMKKYSSGGFSILFSSSNHSTEPVLAWWSWMAILAMLIMSLYRRHEIIMYHFLYCFALLFSFYIVVCLHILVSWCHLFYKDTGEV